MPQTHIRRVIRRPRTRLRVTFSDGTVIDEQQAADTFALALSRLGLPSVEALGIYVRNLPLVSMSRGEEYCQTPIENRYVCTHSSTKEKKKLLERISKKLAAPMEIEILPNV